MLFVKKKINDPDDKKYDKNEIKMMMMTWQWTQEKKTEVLFLDYLGKIVKRRIPLFPLKTSLFDDKRCHHRRLGRHRRAPLLKGWVFFSVLCVRVVVYVVVVAKSSSQTRRPPIFCRSGGTIIIVQRSLQVSGGFNIDAFSSTLMTPTEVTTTTIVVIGKRSSRFRPSRPKRRRRTKTTKTTMGT